MNEQSRELRAKDREINEKDRVIERLQREPRGGGTAADDGASGLATELRRLRRDTVARIVSLMGGISRAVIAAGVQAVRGALVDLERRFRL